MEFRWPFSAQASRTPSLPEGRRAYVIGDIHAEAGLFSALLDTIERDSHERGSALVEMIILGDFIDRGPRSADMLFGLASFSDPRLVILKGNHEATLVDVYRGDEEALIEVIGEGVACSKQRQLIAD